MPLPSTVKREIKSKADNLNVQIKLAYIGQDSDYPAIGNKADGEMFSQYKRMNLRVLEEDGVVPMNNVIVYGTKNNSTQEYIKPNQEDLAIVAMVGKNRNPEACIVIAFVSSDFLKANGNTNVTGVIQPTGRSTAVST